MRLFLCCAITALLLSSRAVGQVIPHHQDRPPGPALSPQEAIAKMTVPEGFQVELVASEPNIVNPVAMTFDERGRIWVTESLEYPRKAPGPGRDRVKVLEDTDADGKADKFTIFAEGLNIPSGIAVGHGGVWVANSPDILFYPDADRDGKPDGPPQVVVSGFGRSDTHELPNSLTWGPDGWLYGLNGVFNFSHIKYARGNPNFREDHPGWQFTCALWRIHPRTREFQVFCEGTSNPWGVAIDPEGSFFVSACVIDHLWHLVETGYYHRQGGPYPPFTWKIDSIVKHKHQKAAYCGIHYFDSDAYPEQYRNKLYMGNIHGNCINVDKLRRDGSTYFATGEPDFLTADDAWFMPVSQKTGPDGCLYVLDWYDQYHCYQDANRDPAGIDRLKGRLYRIRYKDTPRAANFDLSKESDEQLIARLSSGNDFIRHTAQRLLSERSNNESVVPLWKVVNSKDAPLKMRLHALWALLGMKEELGEYFHQALLRDENPTLRAWGVRAAANYDGTSTLVNEAVLKLASDPSLEVQLQVAIAAKKIKGGDPIHVLVEVLANCRNDELIPHIVWQNLYPLLEDQSDHFLEEISKLNLSNAAAPTALLPRVTERLLARQKFAAAPVAAIFVVLRDTNERTARQVLELIATRIQSGEIRGEKLAELREAFAGPLTPVLEKAATHPLGIDAALVAVSWKDLRGVELVRHAFANRGGDAALRLRALAALIAVSDEMVLGAVAAALRESGTGRDFHGQVLAALARHDHPEVATVVLASYPLLAAEAQPKAIELLTQRAGWAKQLVGAIGAGKVPASVLNVNQVQKLLSLDDKELTAAVAKHWGTIRTSRDPQREAFVAEMRKLIRTTPGDPQRGVEVFGRLCGQCHKIHGQGQDVGPDITSNGRASFDQLLSNVFDPSLVIGASYQARTVRTADGRVVTGLLAEDSEQRVVLKVQGGKLETIAKADVEAMKVSELSLMPEGIEKQLKPQEIADLFAFITLDKPPSDKSARPILGVKEGK